jgi:hypothetical protein
MRTTVTLAVLGWAVTFVVACSGTSDTTIPTTSQDSTVATPESSATSDRTETSGPTGTPTATGTTTTPPSSGSPCVAGLVCSVVARCRIGTVSCKTGVAVCEEAGKAADGTSCGAKMVCERGACVRLNDDEGQKKGRS